MSDIKEILNNIGYQNLKDFGLFYLGIESSYLGFLAGVETFQPRPDRKIHCTQTGIIDLILSDIKLSDSWSAKERSAEKILEPTMIQ